MNINVEYVIRNYFIPFYLDHIMLYLCEQLATDVVVADVDGREEGNVAILWKKEKVNKIDFVWLCLRELQKFGISGNP